MQRVLLEACVLTKCNLSHSLIIHTVLVTLREMLSRKNGCSGSTTGVWGEIEFVPDPKSVCLSAHSFLLSLSEGLIPNSCL